MTDPDPSSKTFSEDYVQNLRSEAAGYRTQLRQAQADLATATAANTDLTAKLAEAQTASGSADSRVAAAEATALRLEVALEKGIAPALARRLAGGTREELEADAVELLKLSGQTPPEPKPNPGHGVGDPPKTAGLSPIQAALQKARGGSAT